MFISHLNALEKVLAAQSAVATNAGHPNLRGGPREWFVRDFLEGHLPLTLEIGQGEIVSSKSLPNPSRGVYRPQVDIVLYRGNFPKLSYSKNDFAYLVEGVLATVECKTTLTKEELRQACEAHRKHKNLAYLYMEVKLSPGNILSILPYPISYVVAFDGPADITTAANWLPEITRDLRVNPDQMIDIVVVLGKGVIWRMDAYPTIEVVPRISHEHHWAYVAQTENNLSFMFAHMLMWLPASSQLPSIDYHSPYINLTGECKTV